MLEAEHDLDRRSHRQIKLGRRRLLEERVLRRTDVDRQEPVRLGSLDVLDRLSELRHAERDELLPDHLAAEILQDLASPLGRNLAEVVVGRDV